jgi:hypothetical protein
MELTFANEVGNRNSSLSIRLSTEVRIALIIQNWSEGVDL